MIRGISGPRLALFGVLCLAAFWIAAAVMEFSSLNLFVSCLNLTLAVAAALAYARETIDGLTRDTGPTRGEVLATGICLGMIADAYGRVMALAWRITGDPIWISTDALTFTFYVSGLAAVLHLTAPYDIRVAPRRRSWLALWIALAVGAGLAGFLLGAQWRGSG